MYTKLSFRNGGCFSCHFASLDYTTFGKRTGKPSLRKLNSMAEIIRTRGCSWNKLKWKRNMFYFVVFFPVLSDLSISVWEGTFKKKFWVSCWILSTRPVEQDGCKTQRTTFFEPRDYRNWFPCSNSQEWRTSKTMALQAGWENRGRVKLLTPHHWEPREGLSPSSQG